MWKQLLKNYNEQRRKGIDPVFHRDMLPELKNVECWDGSDLVIPPSHPPKVLRLQA